MLFTSPRFFVFLAVTLVALRIPRTVRAKKLVLGVASTLFYAAWDYRYVLLLLGVGWIDQICAVRIHRAKSEGARRALLAASVVSNLGILGYFKYAGFFLDNLAALGVVERSALSILLPAGISFYTFKSMSYTIDVFRREIEPCERVVDYLTFLTFFPELIAGPIVRASVFLPQMDRSIGPTRERLASGASLFLLGLTKKVGIADRMAIAVDPVFANPSAFGAPALCVATIGYTLQIYADFSGYSDMAIGCAKMIGYDLPENFRMPYLSENPSEFWRRWHITLSSWLRDYLYISLGGNRRGAARTYFNLCATMLLGGLWHGASWNFVLWGALHGLALVVHRLGERSGMTRWIPMLPARIGMLLFAMLCWIPFRARDFGDTWSIVSGIATWRDGLVHLPTPVAWGVAWAIAAHAMGRALEQAARDEASPWRRWLGALDVTPVNDAISGVYAKLGLGTAGGVALVVAWLGGLYLFATFTSDPFIYFQF